MLAALAAYLDSMQQVLAVVLVLISLKIFLEAAGFEVPIAAFLGILIAWRVLAMALLPLLKQRRRQNESVGAVAEAAAADEDGRGDIEPLVKS